MGYHNLFLALVTVTTIISYIHYKYIKIPKTIFLTISSALISLAVSFMLRLMPYEFEGIYALLSGINFRTTILDVMIGYLLFASSLRINSVNLKHELGSVIYLASIGVILSTIIIGSLLWLMTYYVDIHLPYSDCLIFGALISPTDAIIVIAVLKTTTSVPPNIQARVTGEALFNDAVGIVLLVVIVQFFYPSNNNIRDFTQIGVMLLREVAGGMIFGCILGMLAIELIKRINDNELVILITITISGLGHLIAEYLHFSAVISMVIAGLYVGGYSRSNRFSKTNTLILHTFWGLVDDILNGFMFVLIGLEMLTIHFSAVTIIIGILSVILIFIARYISILLPDLILIKILQIKIKSLCSNKERILMSWGGVRGGISIALAWSIAYISPVTLSITYVVVVFSILLQGSTFKILTNWLFPKNL